MRLAISIIIILVLSAIATDGGAQTRDATTPSPSSYTAPLPSSSGGAPAGADPASLPPSDAGFGPGPPPPLPPASSASGTAAPPASGSAGPGQPAKPVTFTLEALVAYLQQKANTPTSSSPTIGQPMIADPQAKLASMPPCYSAVAKFLGVNADGHTTFQLDGCLLNYESNIFWLTSSTERGTCGGTMCANGTCNWRIIAEGAQSGDICLTLRTAQINGVPVRVVGTVVTLDNPMTFVVLPERLLMGTLE